MFFHTESGVLANQYRGARALSDFQVFASGIELDYSRPFSWEDDLVGMETWMILGVKKDDEYGDKNTVSKYVVKK